MNRRGFFSKMFNKVPDVVFYGIQVVIGTYQEEGLRTKIHNIINADVEEENAEMKRSFYKRISSVLVECIPAIEYGHWDYIAKPTPATDEFNSWVREIEASLATEEEEFGEEINEMERLSNQKEYICVSMAFLLEGDRVQSDFLNIIEGIPEDKYFDKATFKQLLEAVNYIEFEYSYGDACFVVPGNDQDGLSWEDIHSEGWSYLKPIM